MWAMGQLWTSSSARPMSSSLCQSRPSTHATSLISGRLTRSCRNLLQGEAVRSIRQARPGGAGCGQRTPMKAFSSLAAVVALWLSVSFSLWLFYRLFRRRDGSRQKQLAAAALGLVDEGAARFQRAEGTRIRIRRRLGIVWMAFRRPPGSDARRCPRASQCHRGEKLLFRPRQSSQEKNREDLRPIGFRAARPRSCKSVAIFGLPRRFF